MRGTPRLLTQNSSPPVALHNISRQTAEGSDPLQVFHSTACTCEAEDKTWQVNRTMMDANAKQTDFCNFRLQEN